MTALLEYKIEPLQSREGTLTPLQERCGIRGEAKQHGAFRI